MARREGRNGRPRSPPRHNEEFDLSDNDQENGNGAPAPIIGNDAAAPIIAPAQLARWSEERHIIILENVESAPNRLHQENPNWGRPVPVQRKY
jgi:hypothetical protein